MIVEIISLASLILIIAMLRRIVVTMPQITLCAVRWKENINLEENIRLSRNRDFIAAALIIPFCLIACEYDLISFHFMRGMSEPAELGMIAAVFLSYMLFRLFTIKVFMPRRRKRGSNKAACDCDRTFFIIAISLLLITKWITGVVNADEAAVKNTMLWISGAIYLLFLIRKYQIFESSHSIFTSFLYLCALEIIPTGTLVVSAMIF